MMLYVMPFMWYFWMMDDYVWLTGVLVWTSLKRHFLVLVCTHWGRLCSKPVCVTPVRIKYTKKDTSVAGLFLFVWTSVFWPCTFLSCPIILSLECARFSFSLKVTLSRCKKNQSIRNPFNTLNQFSQLDTWQTWPQKADQGSTPFLLNQFNYSAQMKG